MAIKPEVEKAIAEGIHTAKLLMKNLIFPEAREFSDIFKGYKVITDLATYKDRVFHQWKDNDGYCSLMAFCRVHGSTQGPDVHLDVDPKDRVVFEIGKRMALHSNFRINFEVVVRPGGSALVVAKYDQILGDRWIAIIDSSTIPTDTLADELSRPESVKETMSTGVLPAIRSILALGGNELPMPKLTTGRYAKHAVQLIGRIVKIPIPTDIEDPDTEHIWVSARRINEPSLRLMGTVAQKPKHSEGFSINDRIEFSASDVEDVLSPPGKDRVYPICLPTDGPFQPDGSGYLIRYLLHKTGDTQFSSQAQSIWEAMSECEQDHAVTLARRFYEDEKSKREP